MRLLIVEDDAEAAAYLTKAFREVGHVADHAADGLEGYAMAEGGGYDVLVVDRMLPRLDGLSLIRSLREQKDDTPALILSALAQVDDRVKGLRAGGDDYLPKPYAFSELLARVEVLARRRGAPASEPTTYRVGELVLDRLAHRVTRAGQEIVLQPREFRLLEVLMDRLALINFYCFQGKHTFEGARVLVGGGGTGASVGDRASSARILGTAGMSANTVAHETTAVTAFTTPDRRYTG